MKALVLAVALTLLSPAPSAASADPLEAHAERVWAAYCEAWTAASRAVADIRTPAAVSAALIAAESEATPAALAMAQAVADLMAARDGSDGDAEAAARAHLAVRVNEAQAAVRRLSDALTPSEVS